MAAEKIRFEFGAMLATVLIALPLLIPTAMVAFNDEKVLMQRQKRALAELPDEGLFVQDPGAYFNKLKNWYSDRVGFGTDAALIYRKFSYFVLNDPAAPNVARGSAGMVFLTAHSGDGGLSSIEMSCPEHERWPEIAATAIDNWNTINTRFNAAGIEPKLLVFPSKKFLYPEHFPPQIPKVLRQRCMQMQTAGNPIDELSLTYPETVNSALPVLIAHKDNPHFYPPENFHADGEAAERAVDGFIDFLGYSDAIKALQGSGFSPGAGDADMYAIYGFKRRVMMGRSEQFPNPGKIVRDRSFARTIEDRTGKASLVLRFSNPEAPIEENVLLIANSYGLRAAPYFSKYFNDVVLVETNGFNAVEQNENFFRDYVFESNFDHTVFILHDENVFSGRLTRYAKALSMTLRGKLDNTKPTLVNRLSDGKAQIFDNQFAAWVSGDWYPFERSGVWTKTPGVAVVDLSALRDNGVSSVDLTMRVVSVPEDQKNDLTVEFCGKGFPETAEKLANSSKLDVFTINLDQCEAYDAELVIGVSSTLPSPYDLGRNNDKRNLGVLLHKIRVPQ